MPNFLLTPYDTRPGQLGDTGPAKYGRGTLTLKYLYDENEDDDIEDLKLDLDDDVVKDINAKIDSTYSNLPSPSPRGSRKYHSDMMMSEFAGSHRNYARKGISPFKQPRHSGPPLGTGGANQAFRTTGNFVGIGTQYGSSRPHKLLGDIEDNPVYNLDDILAPFERSFLRRNNRVKKVLNLLKEYLTL